MIEDNDGFSALQSELINTEYLNSGGLEAVSKLNGLAGLGEILKSENLFGNGMAALLRNNLGDFRGIASPDYLDIPDPEQRIETFLTLGFDRCLTNHKDQENFNEPLLKTGIKRPFYVLKSWNYDPPKNPITIEDTVGSEVDAFMADAFRYLRMLESQFRRFIEILMEKHGDENWIKHRVPEALREKWENKEPLAKLINAR